MSYQGEGAVEAVRDLESKVAKLARAFKTQFKRWVIFNLFTFPFIALFYVPYNIFWLQYTTLQLLKWVLTSGVLAAFFNLFYRPYVGFVTRFLDKHAPTKIVVGKIGDITISKIVRELPLAPLHENCCGCGTCDGTCPREGMRHKDSNTPSVSAPSEESEQ